MDIGAVLSRGAVAGLAGGLMFALANMWFSAAHGKPLVAPFLAISTIFHGSSELVMDQPDVIAGLVLHLGLSLVFGMVFAVGVAMLHLGSPPDLLAAASILYGLVLYVVNFQIIGRIVFPVVRQPQGPQPALRAVGPPRCLRPAARPVLPRVPRLVAALTGHGKPPGGRNPRRRGGSPGYEVRPE
ncbi:hypothetical protein RHODO2019_10465 [Rhodococcus antarcticus]|uniref:Uncharacterized protein n=1 Tax=Rhodococcus antarcticus TaxID=2987751 RepID=A0ABY6NXC3_9NOCA|nr:hypothetical protein [Rhodococcus antarcticus]UZJ23638.1 hypothetical protein RHODO2019_10465 [Rhodococcus antarcticus]